jgi:hypothetical protein
MGTAIREATNFDIPLWPCAVRGLPAVCHHGLRDSSSYSTMDGTNKVCRFKTVCVLVVWGFKRNVQTVDIAGSCHVVLQRNVIIEQAVSSMKKHLAQPVVAGIIKDFSAFHRTFGVRNLVHKSPIIDYYSKWSESVTIPPLSVRYILIFFSPIDLQMPNRR